MRGAACPQAGHTAARPPARRAAGFTLLELLVTLLLVGIILSFATLSLGDGGREEQLSTEARRVGALLELAGEEAILANRQLGLEFSEEGYRFLGRMQNAWAPVTDELLRFRPLPAGLRLTLFLEGRAVDLPRKSGERPLPQVHIFSSGERTPFTLVVSHADERPPRFRLQGGPVGKLTLQRLEGNP